MRILLAQTQPLHALLAVGSLAAACAMLSVVVVLRRWSFIGEGIGHSGYGGAGLAWIGALFFPQLDNEWFPYVGVVVLCSVTALVIGRLSRGNRVPADAAIGVFLVAWLAVGFLAQRIYYFQRGKMPFLYDTILFGRMTAVTPQFTISAIAVSLLVVLILGCLFKEVVAFCFDPLTAQTSGVPVNLIQDVLMLLLALVIVFGTRIAGSVLVTAMLILPATTALLLTRELRATIVISLLVSLIGSLGGVVVNMRWPFVPTGPAMVLLMFLTFVATYSAQRVLANR